MIDQRIDPLKVALGVFVVLGLALTGVAGYAVVASTVGLPSLSLGATVMLLSGSSLVVFVLVASKFFDYRRRAQRRSA
ncbi:hypothetical protein NGM10_06745 [Halorussus salilacus]|uniref:hypothetical protein n=1 Tax=Halorussus salilacus TaxID=2953750 RepID=UPI00209E94D1|nr:hypothetical protein [Halorussus salilacus]USZ69425.1 hypothetical protein NGM10_06745 [Halorussus salilacus]